MLLTVFAVLLAADPILPVDWVYFHDADDKQPENVDVTFGLHGACAGRAVPLAPEQGVVLTQALADGKALKLEPIEISTHGPSAVIIVEHPGPSFYYRMPLDHVKSQDLPTAKNPYRLRGVQLRLPRKLPRFLEITYRIRCADGALSEPFVTRGMKYSYPWPHTGELTPIQ